MFYKNHRKTLFTRSLWLGIAVFFVVFCSCPVKRYIRLHLYRQSGIVENIKVDHFSTNDVKDCTIADRPEHAQPSHFVFVCAPADHDDAVVFFQSAFQSVFNSYIFSAEQPKALMREQDDLPVPVPLYLRMRHLLV